VVDPITGSLIIGAVLLKAVAGSDKSKKEDDYDRPTRSTCSKCGAPMRESMRREGTYYVCSNGCDDDGMGISEWDLHGPG